MASLLRNELIPFRAAVRAGTKMIMLGHLRVPAIDPSGAPVSLSVPAVSYLRNKMGFGGMLITDAMNMGGLSSLSEEEASFMALGAGVNFILHPSDVRKVVSYLSKKGIEFDSEATDRFRQDLLRLPDRRRPDSSAHSALSRSIMSSAISVPPGFRIRKAPLIVIISDEEGSQGRIFIRSLKNEIPECRVIRGTGEADLMRRVARYTGNKMPVITAVFSETRAWKGPAGLRLKQTIGRLAPESDLVISFGNPYLLREIPEAKKMDCYWNSPAAEEAAAGLLLKRRL